MTIPKIFSIDKFITKRMMQKIYSCVFHNKFTTNECTWLRAHSGVYDFSRDVHIPRDDAKLYEMFTGEMTTKPHFTLHGSGS